MDSGSDYTGSDYTGSETASSHPVLKKAVGGKAVSGKAVNGYDQGLIEKMRDENVHENVRGNARGGGGHKDRKENAQRRVNLQSNQSTKSEKKATFDLTEDISDPYKYPSDPYHHPSNPSQISTTNENLHNYLLKSKFSSSSLPFHLPKKITRKEKNFFLRKNRKARMSREDWESEFLENRQTISFGLKNLHTRNKKKKGIIDRSQSTKRLNLTRGSNSSNRNNTRGINNNTRGINTRGTNTHGTTTRGTPYSFTSLDSRSNTFSRQTPLSWSEHSNDFLSMQVSPEMKQVSPEINLYNPQRTIDAIFREKVREEKQRGIQSPRSPGYGGALGFDSSGGESGTSSKSIGRRGKRNMTGRNRFTNLPSLNPVTGLLGEVDINLLRFCFALCVFHSVIETRISFLVDIIRDSAVRHPDAFNCEGYLPDRDRLSCTCRRLTCGYVGR